MSASNSINTAAVGSDETQFFARVRRVVDSRESYNEFLRLINLFTQGYIDRARLVRESVYFLGDGELMYQLKEILGWDEAQDKAALAREREEGLMPGRPLGVLDRPSKEELNIRHGSYRRLPADVSIFRVGSTRRGSDTCACRISTCNVPGATRCASQS